VARQGFVAWQDFVARQGRANPRGIARQGKESTCGTARCLGKARQRGLLEGNGKERLCKASLQVKASWQCKSTHRGMARQGKERPRDKARPRGNARQCLVSRPCGEEGLVAS
jgi:hypothetical protein